MPNGTILIAAEDEAVTEELTTSLERLGYLVVSPGDRSEAILPMVKDILPDLVFMEIVIKGEINGVEVGRQIQADFDIPVIFIRAQADSARGRP